MTTASTTTRIRHDSDAVFREWGLEFQTQVLAAGLVADELTTNWTTATRPGVNTEYGYEVYHLGDSLHGTAPIYIRFGYGTGAGTTTPRLQVTIGTTTNGSGVIGGTALRTIISLFSSGAETTDTTRVSRWIATTGFFGIWYKTGSSTSAAFLTIARTSNYTGVPDGQSTAVIYSNTALGSVRISGGRNDGSFIMIDNGAGAGANALTLQPQRRDVGADTDKIIYPAGFSDPLTQRWLPGIIGRNTSDGVAAETTFTANDIGGNSHTYIAIATNSPGLVMDANSVIRYCILWE